MIFEQIFEQIGLTAADAKVYQQLMSMKKGTPSSLAKAVNVSRENSYYILKKLVDLGLVVQIPGAKKLTFQVGKAENLQRLFEEKESQLSNSKALLPDALAFIDRQLSKNQHAPAVRYYENIAGVKQSYFDFLAGEKDGEILGMTNFEWPKELDRFFVTERIKMKIGLKLLLVKTTLGLQSRITNPKELRETRIMPTSEFPTGTYLAVLKNRVLIVNQPKGSDVVGVGVVIDHNVIANAFRSMFEMIWKPSSLLISEKQSDLV